MVTKTLNIAHRLGIVSILPRVGNILTLRVLHDLIQKLSLSADEMFEYGVQQVPEGIQFNKKGEEEKPIELTNPEITMIQDQLKALADQSKLKIEHLGIYDKFFP
jgi:hypothetical protein